MNDNKPILDIQNLSIAFQAGRQLKNVVHGISFSVNKGACLGLVGESGSGKTLSALTIMQLLPSTAYVGSEARILLHGEDLLQYSEKAMRHVRGKRIGMIFQDAMSAFNPVFTVGQQLNEVIRAHTHQQSPKSHALTLLDQVGIKDTQRCYASYPHQLSGGMLQRAMIAMALAGEPEILIADEPSTALDVTIQAQVLDLLQSLQRQHSMTLLFISHDLAVVSQLADEVVVLRHGKVVESNSAQHFFSAPQDEYSQQLLAAIPANEPRHHALSDNATLLKVDDLKIHFPIKKGVFKRTVGYVKAVDGVSFTIPQGETLALVGESGSGKTTTGKAILRLLNSTAGSIQLGDRDITHLSPKKMRRYRSDMQFIFQDPFAALDPRMLVGDSIMEGLRALKIVKNRKQGILKVDSILEQVGLSPDIKWRYPHEFSGGQRQRICIARALVLEPKLLVLDEPTSALDVSIQMQILNLLDELQQRLKLTYLLITHNLAVVAHMSHYIAVMKQGKLVEQGKTVDVLTQPQHQYTQKLLAAIPTLQHAESTQHAQQ